jgi:hypothetical protein
MNQTPLEFTRCLFNQQDEHATLAKAGIYLMSDRDIQDSHLRGNDGLA